LSDRNNIWPVKIPALIIPTVDEENQLDTFASDNLVSPGTTTTATTVLRPFVRDYPGEPVPEETLTHPPS